MTYDLRRLRAHGLIQRIPGTFRYTITDTGHRHARFLTRVHDRIWRTGLANLQGTDSPTPSRLRAARLVSASL
jgi:Mn-dependent DtxR family transcriptional regulator